jgi:hypothetical protein
MVVERDEKTGNGVEPAACRAFNFASTASHVTLNTSWWVHIMIGTVAMEILLAIVQPIISAAYSETFQNPPRHGVSSGGAMAASRQTYLSMLLGTRICYSPVSGSGPGSRSIPAPSRCGRRLLRPQWAHFLSAPPAA